MSFYTPTTATPSALGNTPLPIGNYRVSITNAEVRENKAGTGKYLKLEFSALEAPHANRRVWQNINIFHPTPDVVTRARAEMDRLCWAARKADLSAPSDLIGATIVLKLGIKTNKDTGEAEQVVRDYLQDTGPGTVSTPAPAAPARAATPAWAK